MSHHNLQPRKAIPICSLQTKTDIDRTFIEPSEYLIIRRVMICLFREVLNIIVFIVFEWPFKTGFTVLLANTTREDSSEHQSI